MSQMRQRGANGALMGRKGSIGSLTAPNLQPLVAEIEAKNREEKKDEAPDKL